MKSCSFLHVCFFEAENLFKKKLMVKNSFIEKTYVVGTNWNYVTKNKEENSLEIYTFQVSCPFLPLLNIINCQSVLNSCHSNANCLHLHDRYISKIRVNDLPLC